MRFQLSQKIPRETLGFTQGLEFVGTRLLEGTGALGNGTRLNSIALNGHVTQIRDFGTNFFGEGITVLDGKIYQLSWKEHQVSVYDLKGKLLRRMQNNREGWGLTHDTARLIFSDGSDQLFYASPKDFSVMRSVTVRMGARPMRDLNELEYVSGKIYANVFLTNNILRIDANSGCVEAEADMSDLLDYMTGAERAHMDSDINYVLNGIAFDKTRGLFYVTGKMWNSIFAGRFIEK